MIVSELFQSLSLGELSNLSISDEGSGEIVPGKKPKILGYVNEALLRLYSRFVLLEDDLLLGQLAHILNYPLELKYALTEAPAPAGKHSYILDGPGKPFTGNVIRILRVRNDWGLELPLNDTEDSRSVFTPSPKVLRVPKPISNRFLGIDYQASHPKLTSEDDEILLPETLHKALSSYVAHLTYSHMSGQEPSAKAQEHLAMYEAICAEVEAMDLVNSSTSTTNTMFAKRGFV